jgi:PilZ domain-containing protein
MHRPFSIQVSANTGFSLADKRLPQYGDLLAQQTAMEERRRSNRIAIGHIEPAYLPSSEAVRVLDISVTGVLLQSSRSIEPGTRGSLKLNFGGSPFSADVEVRRAVPTADGGSSPSYRVGASFVAITPEHRQLIERFANQ